MNNRKNYNSIVFLTTLSVYLGLVLAGGAMPSVLAQAATTRGFDIKNEIVVEDDLDKKPDDDLFAEAIVELVKNLNVLSDNEKFSWQNKSALTIEDLGFCESDNSPSFLGSGAVSRNVSDVFDKAGVKIGRKLFKKKSDFGLGDFYSDYPETITFKFLVENKSFNIETQINLKTDEAAQSFANLINTYLSQIESSASKTRTKVVAENTKSKVDAATVLLVTNLPRASIDSLLAEKDAQ
jgi:hypothetical protein